MLVFYREKIAKANKEFTWAKVQLAEAFKCVADAIAAAVIQSFGNVHVHK